MRLFYPRKIGFTRMNVPLDEIIPSYFVRAKIEGSVCYTYVNSYSISSGVSVSVSRRQGRRLDATAKHKQASILEVIPR